MGLYNGNNDPTTATPHQQAWAQLVGREVTDDLVAQGTKVEFPWANNATVVLDRSDIEFGEINNHSINSEFDATICEVAFHDNTSDAADMRDPKVRDWVARASLEATIRYLAADVGARGIRVNAISAGPVNTLAARGIRGFTEILKHHAEKAPLKRNVELREVGDTALFLASPLSSGITGEVIYVDCGYHIMAV